MGAQQQPELLSSVVLKFQLKAHKKHKINYFSTYYKTYLKIDKIIPVTVHSPHLLRSVRIWSNILGNFALLDSVDRKFCSTSSVTKCSANFLTTSSYCTVLASESHTKHRLKIKKFRGYFSSDILTG